MDVGPRMREESLRKTIDICFKGINEEGELWEEMGIRQLNNNIGCLQRSTQLDSSASVTQSPESKWTFIHGTVSSISSLRRVVLLQREEGGADERCIFSGEARVKPNFEMFKF